ncbi:cation:proton antiporter [Nitratifractor sp.]|uniref:cation:proton antiporter n=1 Tax=Nitratifractor sp. TaxID=2268144 RepID=UPI0025FF23A3|nr:cation:proton antiporter [Nitratifractor sp.]
MQELFYVGLIFVLGAFMKWVSYKFKLLNVVGYLILGFIIGPHMLDIVPQSFIDNSHIIIDISLSLIAVLVGANLKYEVLWSVWKQIAVISVFEALFTFVLMGSVLYSMFHLFDFGLSTHYRLAVSLLFGALASATAPATILAVIHELKVKSRFSAFLLGVVAADNAITLVLFSFVLIVAGVSMETTTHALDQYVRVIPTIFFTVIVGAVGAAISEGIDRIFRNYRSIKTTSTLGMIFIVYSVSDYFGLEPLLASLAMGVVLSNISTRDFYLVKREFDFHLKDIIFMLFFTLSAMHLDIRFVLSMPMVVFTYIIVRFIGKVSGVWIGGWVSHSSDAVRKYLGLALFPQAGIAIGLALSLQEQAGFGIMAPLMLNVIIATTMVHELLGPFLTKYALERSGK